MCQVYSYHRFPVLTAWFATSAVLSLVLFEVRRDYSSAYASVYSVACLLGILLETACIVEVFFALCGKFRNFVRIGGGLLVILWVVAIAAAAAVRLAWVPAGWTRTWQVVMLGARYADFAMVLVVAAAWLLLRWPGIPIARSAERAASVILGHAVWGFLVSTVTIAHGDPRRWWAQLLPMVGGCLTAGGAILLLRFVPGEYALPPAPSREELEEAIADSDRVMEEMADLKRNFLRGLHE